MDNMKDRLLNRRLNRTLCTVAGALLVIFSIAMLAQVIFRADFSGLLTSILTAEPIWLRILIGLLAIVLLAFGALVILGELWADRSYVTQQMEDGELAISFSALEQMVHKCVDLHPEIEPRAMKLENQRDGLLIRIIGTVAQGISIPLTVESMQKQIKQYVTDCSGVEISGIRVEIETTGKEIAGAPFAIEAPVAPQPLPQGSSEQDSPAQESAPVDGGAEGTDGKAEPEAPASAEDTTAMQSAAAMTAAAAAMTAAAAAMSAAPAAAQAQAVSAADKAPEMSEYDEDDDRPIHQRIFSPKEEPCIVPLPPEEEAETPAEPDPEAEGALDSDQEAEADPASAWQSSWGEAEDIRTEESDEPDVDPKTLDQLDD